jgi:signal transduction histidine kinase
VAIWVNPTSLHILVNNNFFFVSSVIISMVAGYMLERSLRTEFKQRRLIEEQRAALADHNAELGSALQDTLEEVRRNADELAASRARIVAAADAERRRIERNLHDGAQQRLVALALHLGLAARTSVDDGQAAAADLLQLRDEVQEALDELRTLAHGIYPPLLMDKGLEAALRAAAKRASQPATVRAESLRRYPAETEAAVYFCCLEALQNAAKHAGPDATILITVREEPGALRFEVTDDGAGFDAKTKSAGSGFTNMSDRLGAVGGTVSVDAAPGRGTRVGGWLPLDGEPNGGLGADRAAPEVRAPSSAV